MSAEDPQAKAKEQSKRPRNIVVLLDGTGNQFSARNSSVIKTLSVLEADEEQLLYYSSGVGTVHAHGESLWGKLGHKLAVLSDETFAWSFGDFVCDAYKFLMDYHQTGDRVYIFGFSRGAYTARALAGMVQKVGLLPPGNHNQIKLAYGVYAKEEHVKSPGDKTIPLSTQYRRIFGISRPVVIHFIGVWDTVSSLGGLRLPRLPFASGVGAVTYFRQALALDERRARFKPEYRRVDKTQSQAALAEPSAPDDKETNPRQSVECWFLGCHSDVGGGNDPNFQHSLSNIPLRWMLREAVVCGIRLDAAQVVCQPALSNVPSVRDSGVIPEQLRNLLDETLSASMVDQVNEEAVQALIKDHLPPQVLREIVKSAAAYDTALDGDEGTGGPISEDLKHLPKESLTLKWYIVEVLVLQTRTYSGTEEDDRDSWKRVKVAMDSLERVDDVIGGTSERVDRSLRAIASTDPSKSDFDTTAPSRKVLRSIKGRHTKVPRLLCRMSGGQAGTSFDGVGDRRFGKIE